MQLRPWPRTTREAEDRLVNRSCFLVSNQPNSEVKIYVTTIEVHRNALFYGNGRGNVMNCKWCTNMTFVGLYKLQ